MTAPFRCATCVFFVQHRPQWSDRPSPRGQCRRNAPVLDRQEDGHLRTVWPMVHQDAFCGEHAEVPEVVAEPLAPMRHRCESCQVVDGHAPHCPENNPPDDEPGEPAGPAWRCDTCQLDHVGAQPPERCTSCRCRTFSKVEP